MPQNRLLASLGTVAAYLLGIGLLQYIISSIASLFGLLPAALAPWVGAMVMAVVPIVGTIVYLDWRWAWRLEHIGMEWNGQAAVRLVLGAVLGLLAALAAHSVTWLMSGPAWPLLPQSWNLRPFTGSELITVLGGAFATEMVFRGAVVSRYEADLHDWEIVGAAVLTPFLWDMVQRFMRLGMLDTAVGSLWLGAMSVSLTLLFLRFESAWLTAGLRFGMATGMMLLPLVVSDNSALIIWGAVAVVLAVLEWFRRQGMPRKLPPRRGPQRVVRGKTVRGPWGPH
ncbi:MAG TPA: hypothetical protein VGK74_05870 [Symbiobacteriaceae bacterium]|jgi:hypothetical protein